MTLEESFGAIVFEANGIEHRVLGYVINPPVQSDSQDVKIPAYLAAYLANCPPVPAGVIDLHL